MQTILVNEREAADMLGLTPRTLQAWRQQGEGPPYVRVSSRCIRYRIADLEDWAEGLLQNSTSEDD